MDRWQRLDVTVIAAKAKRELMTYMGVGGTRRGQDPFAWIWAQGSEKKLIHTYCSYLRLMF